MQEYNPKEIESKWQKYWEEKKTYKTPENATHDNKMYILPQLPYPSGSGLHVGHAEVYTACDIYARYQRMLGKKVLQVIGWDSFGLPAENYAIKTNIHPQESTEKAIDTFREQIKSLGISVDWEREVGSHNPDYYKWTQWFFLLFYKRGLAYRKKQSVNWCDSCKTVLANEQVEDGKCERCSTVVEQRDMEQWYLKITEYADRLLKDLDKVDWPEETVKRQKDWIGRSEGAMVEFKIQNSKFKISVFTTRPDTLFGATYMVLAPEHELVQDFKNKIENWEEVEEYISQTKLKTDLDRQTEKEKTGVELKGIKAINPVNNEEIPVWIADYVLSSYGTGAIMAVPAHDERDWEFAKKYGLPIKQVVARQIGDRKEEGYCRPGAYGIIQKDNKVFVLFDKEHGYYRLPGGGFDKEDKTPEEALKRELAEETGFVNYEIGEHFTKLEACSYTGDGEAYQHRMLHAYYVKLIDETRNKDLLEEHKDWDYHWMTYDEAVDAFDSNPQEIGEIDLIALAMDKQTPCFTGEGVSVNSDFLDELITNDAKEKMIAWLEENKLGERKVQYKLRDWSVSRQRFWGAPIPMLYDEKGELHPVPENDLPVLLPNDVDFKPTGESPLNYSKDFNAGVEEKYGRGWKREPDTLDTFMCSSWYYYRYLDPHNDKEFASPESLKTWMPVDFYLGGPEHVNGHLLYSRFFTKVLFDEGLVGFDEPFLKHRHQGLILGEDNRKMSKRWGNVINPTDIVNEFGADTARMYEMFMGPLEDDKPWDMNGVKGIRRFLEKIWKLQDKVQADAESDSKLLHKTIKKVTEDIEKMHFNTAISAMMELVNEWQKADKISKEDFAIFVKLLSPFAPHMAEELWSELGSGSTITFETWPEYDESLIQDDMITLVVQINGKVRANLEVSADISESEAKDKALEEDNVKKWLEGKQPKKVIYVKGKLVSIVV
ncbi:MAG: leucine--tRNA ligase [Candidatus Magasanikbacteria bacterium]|nr:leucine--tRNA ligase [Candidatus Magasanikbacteria bacterium]